MCFSKKLQIWQICISGALFLFYASKILKLPKIVLSFLHHFRFQRKNPAPKYGIFACIFFVWCARRDLNPHVRIAH